MKTPEEMADEYERFNWCVNGLKSAFLAGYQAAKDESESKIEELETQLENWQHTAIHGDEGI